jgi:hypothetical protein
MKAVSAIAQLKAHRGQESGKDSWQQVKPGTGAIVEELSTAQEWDLMGLSADCSAMDPLELLIAIEDGTSGLE